MVAPGRREVVVGRNVTSQFEGARLGGKVPVRDGDWAVVGVFETGGDVHESEIWVDRAVIDGVLRSSFIASVIVALDSPAAFDTFKAALSTDPRVNVDVRRETAYYAAQSQATGTFIRVLGTVVGVIMAIGADVRGAQHHVFGGVEPRDRDRNAARHRFRRTARSRIGAARGSWCSPWSAVCSAV